MYNIPHFQVTSVQMTSLPGQFRSAEVTWRYFPSRDSPASYSLVWSEMYSIRMFLAFYIQYQGISCQMTSPSGHFRLPQVTWHRFPSRDCLLLWATAWWEVKCTVYASFRTSPATSRRLWVKWCHFRSPAVTWRHFLLHDCLLIPATAL